ncbi:MAG TPA: universal stress protein [Candidatus Limiplasma sp.]|nr:universal stress protein [Candidatus Limiplasma sp.]HPS82253.1 universal stress protein [Candidatus Limiplasma sp.]
MDEHPPILVLVTLQRACARLIRRGVDIALQDHCTLHVLHVVANEPHPACEAAIDAQALDYLYALAGEADAQMTVLTADVAVTAMAEFAAQQGVKKIVMGGGEQASGIAETLSELLPGVQVMIADDGE